MVREPESLQVDFFERESDRKKLGARKKPPCANSANKNPSQNVLLGTQSSMPDPREMREQELLVRRALDQHESALLAFTTNVLHGDVERARDVVQDALIKLYQADPDKVRENLKAWLYTVCRNRALDVLRKERRLEFGNDIALEQAFDEGPEPGHQADVDDLSCRAWEIVASLPVNHQEVLRLKFQHDCSYQQIADITGLSVSNVGFILHTTLKKIRHQLQRQLSKDSNSRKT